MRPVERNIAQLRANQAMQSSAGTGGTPADWKWRQTTILLRSYYTTTLLPYCDAEQCRNGWPAS